MFVTPATSRKRASAAHSIGDSASETPSSPPIITPAAKHPVYGKTPMGRDGFTLERQQIQMLNHWHKKATEIASTVGPDRKLARIVAGQIFEAAIHHRLSSGSEVAEQLEIVLREMRTEDTVTVIGIEDFATIVNMATKATAPFVPKKRLPALAKGRNLTRAGLLFRYHAFLVGELRTLSWLLYGDRDFASQTHPSDDAVNIRCRIAGPQGRTYPFFNEKSLPARARSVLKSLKVDTERTVARNRRRTVSP